MRKIGGKSGIRVGECHELQNSFRWFPDWWMYWKHIRSFRGFWDKLIFTPRLYIYNIGTGHWTLDRGSRFALR
jgi:hypothetical protein